jgi:hypothetical protein
MLDATDTEESDRRIQEGMMISRRYVGLVMVMVSALAVGCWRADGVRPAGGASDFADPGLLFANGRYYRYATNGGGRNVPVQSAPYPTGPWTTPVEAFPHPPSWVKAPGHFWGPDVQRIGNAYYLYYSAKIADGGKFGEHAIGVARSSSPTGPFQAIGPQPLYRDPSRRGVIDPEVVFDGTRQYLAWSTDWGPNGRGSGVLRTIRTGRMSTPTSTPTSVRTVLQAGAAWELGTVEGPAFVRGGDGNWHLFYSGGDFDRAYGIGYALCGKTPATTCKRLSDEPVARSGWKGTFNPGGLDFIPGYGFYIGMFHSGPLGARRPWTGVLHWVE